MKSYRQILHSSAIIGSASAINIIVGVIRIKVIAVLLGPAGVGLVGLYQNLMATTATLLGCGLESSGVRQIAAAQKNPEHLAVIRKSIWWANGLLGTIGIALLWLLREHIAKWLFQDTAYADQVKWLGLGVLLSLMVSARMAWLQGMRQVKDVAKINIFGALLSAFLGVAFILRFGSAAVPWFVIAAPASSLIFANWYARQSSKPAHKQKWPVIILQWRAMLSLGIPLMLAGLLTLLTQFVVRGWITRKFGVDAAGYFQSAWSISNTYIGFVLGAMAIDYFPRLTKAIHEPILVKTLVNEQTEMALYMAAPVLLAMLTFAPEVINLMYANSFTPAADILRWQVIGDLFKMFAWPMGFIVLAKGRGDLFIITQLNWNIIYLLSFWLGIEFFGLHAVGIAFLVAYVFQALLVRMLVGKLISFESTRSNLILFTSLLIASIIIMVTFTYAPRFLVPIGLSIIISFFSCSLWHIGRILEFRNFLRTRK